MDNLRKQGIRLYYNILKLHRYKLPPKMRLFGDKYVQLEFRQHRKAEDNHYLKFLQGWIDYYQQLYNAPTVKDIGKHISEEDMNFFTAEQKIFLEQLKTETFNAASSKSDSNTKKDV
eukprot:TRINITY_DN2052_c0_g2_i6.p1 TRINITY_DN2052_c0_g2~~TRINITY_DN2052_c0_g2_i6.p1  ORF type:complete len:117 (-),score=33.31 TRINITY_DN2052_c0_g2_i6:95-445(-)